MKCIETYVTFVPCVPYVTLTFCDFNGLVVVERRVKHAKFGFKR